MKSIILLLLILLAVAFVPVGLRFFSPYGVSGSGTPDARAIYQKAIDQKDISICDKVHLIGFGDVTDSELKGTCYVDYAHALPAQHVCPALLADAPDRSTVDGKIAYLGYEMCLDSQRSGQKIN